MRRACPIFLLPAFLVLLLPSTLHSQEEGTISKRKEGTYFLELGEVFFRTDDYDMAVGRFDPDGPDGPEALGHLKLPNDDISSTDPRVTLGLNRPHGKWTLAFTAWQFNFEDSLRRQTDPSEVALDSAFTLPGLLFGRPGGINPLQDLIVDHERDLKFFGASWERNLHETKLHRTRLLVGFKYFQFEDRVDAVHQYADERLSITGAGRAFNDLQIISSEAKSDRIGPSIGAESRFTLGKRFRLTSRAELQIAEESIVVNYRNTAAEISPSIQIDDSGFRFGRGSTSPPFGVVNRDLLAAFGEPMRLFIFDTSENKIVPTGEISVRGAWDLPHGITAGLEWRWLGVFDLPSAHLAAEEVRDTITTIDADIINVFPADVDPDNDKVVFNFDVGDVVQRHDVVYNGLNFFLRFNF